MLNIDLHTHTNRYSSCSTLSPEALCEVALQHGLDAIAITEHHHQWSVAEISDLQSRYPALKLYSGVEVSATDRHDYVILGLEAEIYWPHPTPIAWLQSLLHAPDTFCFVAHCFRYSTSEYGLAERRIDGIEMKSPNMLERRWDTTEIAHAALYEKWRKKMNWIGLYNSDGHNERMVGMFYNVIDAAQIPPDEQALIWRLRQDKIASGK